MATTIEIPDGHRHLCEEVALNFFGNWGVELEKHRDHDLGFAEPTSMSREDLTMYIRNTRALIDRLDDTGDVMLDLDESFAAWFCDQVISKITETQAQAAQFAPVDYKVIQDYNEILSYWLPESLRVEELSRKVAQAEGGES